MNPADDFKDVVDGGGIRPATLLHLGCYGLLIFGFLFIAKQWHEEGIARTRAEATQEAEKRYREAVELERKEKLAEISQDVKATKTPEQAMHILPKYIPVPFNVPTEVHPVGGKLPDAPVGQKYAQIGEGDRILKAEDQVQLVQFGAKCKEDGINLSACEKNVVSITAEREKWKEAAKGGSKWHRFGKALKIIGCASGGAALGSLSKQRGGAAIGAAVGAGGCQLLF